MGSTDPHGVLSVEPLSSHQPRHQEIKTCVGGFVNMYVSVVFIYVSSNIDSMGSLFNRFSWNLEKPFF